jgi:hypothetical protein
MLDAGAGVGGGRCQRKLLSEKQPKVRLSTLRVVAKEKPHRLLFSARRRKKKASTTASNKAHATSQVQVQFFEYDFAK